MTRRLTFVAVAIGAMTLLMLPLHAWATFPGRDGKIVFVSYRTGGGDVYVVNRDGTGLTRLTRSPHSDLDPAWSPDGDRIAYAARGPLLIGEPTRSHIVLIKADGTPLRTLTTQPIVGGGPTWSPDGGKLAYFRSDNGEFLKTMSIYVMHADGTGETRLTDSPARDYDPQWSPAGTWIAFMSNRDRQRTHIFFTRSDGSALRRLPHPGGWEDGAPSWSPDGIRIAFESWRRGGEGFLFISGIDGRRRVNLTRKFGFRGFSPAWAPDGRRLLFTCQRRRVVGLCIGDLRSGRVEQVTGRGRNRLGRDGLSDWQALQ